MSESAWLVWYLSFSVAPVAFDVIVWRIGREEVYLFNMPMAIAFRTLSVVMHLIIEFMILI